MEIKNQAVLMKSMISFDQLIHIFNNSHDGIMVTNHEGLILFATSSASVYLGIPLDKLILKNVNDLIKNKTYDNSIILKAIESKKQKTGIVNMFNGNRVISTVTPILDENNRIIMTITNTRTESLIDKFAEELEKEKINTIRYKTAVNYISSLNENSSKVIADSPQMKKILRYLKRASELDSTVLLLGESGTGKDVLSKFIHDNSNRKDEPFIPVNCAAIPNELMESEFFGYEKGAFSGALTKGKPGFFEMADKGTLFLDEIAEMPMNIQSKFLRIIETGEFQRLGGTNFIKTNVRIVAATNRNLKDCVRKGTFREDLFYRLNVVPVEIPPLRERKEDIISLANYFINQINRQYGTNLVLSQTLTDKFLNYNWPGNIRELRNIIEQLALVLNEDDLVFTDKKDLEFKKEVKENNIKECSRQDLINGHECDLKSLTELVEKEYIEKVLIECNWKVSDAAKILGLHRSMIYRKMQELNIKKHD